MKFEKINLAAVFDAENNRQRTQPMKGSWQEWQRLSVSDNMEQARIRTHFLNAMLARELRELGYHEPFFKPI